MGNGATFSVLGADVVIRGNVEASADLHLDGSVDGDIICGSLVQGASSRIEGAIVSEAARLSGQVKGSVTACDLVVLRTARIDGDVHYQTLTIEQGAEVQGRFAPDAAEWEPAPAASPKGPGSYDGGEPRLTLAG